MASTYLLKKFKNIENISNANADFNKELLRGNCNLVEIGFGNDDKKKKIELEEKKIYLNTYDKPKEK